MNIQKVVKKAWDFEVVRSIYADKAAVWRDLEMVLSFCDLDLEKLLKFPSFHFLHDILGIARHLNRTRGRFDDHFVPRSIK